MRDKDVEEKEDKHRGQKHSLGPKVQKSQIIAERVTGTNNKQPESEQN